MTFWVGYAVLVSLVCGVFALTRRPGSRPVRAAEPAPAWRQPDLSASTVPYADVGVAAAVALQRIRPLISSQFSHIDIGISPGLLARMREGAMTDLLEEMLAAAVHAAPASHLLLTALRQGDQIEIAVTDDMAGADPAYRQAQLRRLQERVALRGGSLQVAVNAASGTTVTLRVLAALEAPRGIPPMERTAPTTKPRLAVNGTQS